MLGQFIVLDRQAWLPLQCSCSVVMLFTNRHDDDPLQFIDSSALSKVARSHDESPLHSSR